MASQSLVGRPYLTSTDSWSSRLPPYQRQILPWLARQQKKAHATETRAAYQSFRVRGSQNRLAPTAVANEMLIGIPGLGRQAEININGLRHRQPVLRRPFVWWKLSERSR